MLILMREPYIHPLATPLYVEVLAMVSMLQQLIVLTAARGKDNVFLLHLLFLSLSLHNTSDTQHGPTPLNLDYQPKRSLSAEC